MFKKNQSNCLSILVIVLVLVISITLFSKPYECFSSCVQRQKASTPAPQPGTVTAPPESRSPGSVNDTDDDDIGEIETPKGTDDKGEDPEFLPNIPGDSPGSGTSLSVWGYLSSQPKTFPFNFMFIYLDDCIKPPLSKAEIQVYIDKLKKELTEYIPKITWGKGIFTPESSIVVYGPYNVNEYKLKYWWCNDRKEELDVCGHWELPLCSEDEQYKNRNADDKSYDERSLNPNPVTIGYGNWPVRIPTILYGKGPEWIGYCADTSRAEYDAYLKYAEENKRIRIICKSPDYEIYCCISPILKELGYYNGNPMNNNPKTDIERGVFSLEKAFNGQKPNLVLSIPNAKYGNVCGKAELGSFNKDYGFSEVKIICQSSKTLLHETFHTRGLGHNMTVVSITDNKVTAEYGDKSGIMGSGKYLIALDAYVLGYVEPIQTFDIRPNTAYGEFTIELPNMFSTSTNFILFTYTYTWVDRHWQPYFKENNYTLSYYPPPMEREGDFDYNIDPNWMDCVYLHSAYGSSGTLLLQRIPENDRNTYTTNLKYKEFDRELKEYQTRVKLRHDMNYWESANTTTACPIQIQIQRLESIGTGVNKKARVKVSLVRPTL